MGTIGIWQIVIVAVLVLLLFGRGKISSLMGDVAKGITSFRKGLKEGGEEPSAKDPGLISNDKGDGTSSPEKDKTAHS